MQCAESIAYLHMLHTVPTQPRPNCLSDFTENREGYTLSFEQERHLASALAFLSSIQNDSNYIPAVCVKENRQPSSLEVFLAVNKGQWDDGNDILEGMKQGFEKLFEVLRRVSTDDAMVVEQDAFSAIVSMCSSRILYRLRLKMRPSKPPIKKVLQDVLSSLPKGASSNFSAFTKTVKDIVKLIDAYTKHQTQHELEAVVEGFHRLQQLKDAGRVINAIPNRSMNPTTRKSLLDIIKKVARYRECARYLRRLATKNSLLRQMEVVLVQLDAEAFRRVPIEHLEPMFTTRLPQNTSKKGKRRHLENICRILDTTVPEASRDYARQTRKTLEEAKVHAEIQLLFHFELEKSELPPRVVCSSKDACFLCNTFIAMHGKMHTPRSHGRLYPAWRLPHTGSSDLHSRFVEHLDSLVKASLATLVARSKKTVYPCPNESTVLTLPVSATTLCSQGTHRSILQTCEKSLPVPETVEKPMVETTIPEPPKPQPPNGSALSAASPSCDTSSVSTLTDLSAAVPGEEDVYVTRDIRLPEMARANRISPFYSDGALEVHVEYSTNTVADGGLHKQLPFSVEWVSAEEAERVREGQAQAIVDAESMEAEVSLSLDGQNSVFISARGSLVKVTFGPPVTADGGTHVAGAEENDSL
ncbi:hypothetical protein PG987_013266 [Apiospora arundinis]